MMFHYTIERKYRDKLTVDMLKSIGDGQVIAKGFGTYSELQKEPIRWIAVRGGGHDDFAMYYGTEKQDIEYIRHNGEKILTMSLVKELLNCDPEVIKHYRR